MSAPSMAVGLALEPLEIVNAATGEKVVLHADVSPEEAYHLAVNVKTMAAMLSAYARRCEELIASDMEERGATERLVDNVVYEYKPGSEWVCDDVKLVGALDQLAEEGVISAEERNAAIIWPPAPLPKVHNGKLNALLKRGARVEELVGPYRRQMPTAPKLAIKKVTA